MEIKNSPIPRNEAIEKFNDARERKYTFQLGEKPSAVHVIETPTGQIANPPLHEEMRTRLSEVGIYHNPDDVRGGYLMSEGGELLHWGPSNVPVRPATEEEFQEAVDKYGIQIVDSLFNIEKNKL